jgi:hypothetical protein
MPSCQSLEMPLSNNNSIARLLIYEKYAFLNRQFMFKLSLLYNNTGIFDLVAHGLQIIFLHRRVKK